MTLTYIYNSCYVMEYDKFAIIIDFYKDSTGFKDRGYVHDNLLKRVGKLYVLCSHSHADHFNNNIMRWECKIKNIVYIFSTDIIINKSDDKTIHYLKKGDMYQDENLTVKAYGTTDLGISFLFNIRGKKYFHAGDLNNWHWNMEVCKESSELYEKNYLKELNDIVKEVKNIYLLMFPLDPRLGKDFTRGAEQFIEKINVSIFAPMHFEGDFSALDEYQNFLKSHFIKYMNWSSYGESVIID